MNSLWRPAETELSILLTTSPPFWLQATVVWAGIVFALVLTGLGALALVWFLGADGG